VYFRKNFSEAPKTYLGKVKESQYALLSARAHLVGFSVWGGIYAPPPRVIGLIYKLK
jgi:hypothetical protein